MRGQLKDIGFRLTELADYLGISRPTLYKYIECYESGDYGQIRPDILVFFGFLEANPGIDKRSVLQYIVSHMGGDGKSEDMAELVEAMERFGLPREKVDFILSVVGGSWMDDLIPYLNRYRAVMGRPDLEDEAEEFSHAVEEFKKRISRGVE
ncbi:MAG: helix-turn-helix domain-containing protein [Thermoplasmata archaeon]|nr:helix-turn-helix domain-containing protein [Thermoplasmata archaeon]